MGYSSESNQAGEMPILDKGGGNDTKCPTCDSGRYLPFNDCMQIIGRGFCPVPTKKGLIWAIRIADAGKSVCQMKIIVNLA